MLCFWCREQNLASRCSCLGIVKRSAFKLFVFFTQNMHMYKLTLAEAHRRYINDNLSLWTPSFSRFRSRHFGCWYESANRLTEHAAGGLWFGPWFYVNAFSACLQFMPHVLQPTNLFAGTTMTTFWRREASMACIFEIVLGPFVRRMCTIAMFSFEISLQ